MSAFWAGRTKIAPGQRRRARRIKNRRPWVGIDRRTWDREVATVRVTHREPDGSRSEHDIVAWIVERAPRRLP